MKGKRQNIKYRSSTHEDKKLLDSYIKRVNNSLNPRLVIYTGGDFVSYSTFIEAHEGTERQIPEFVACAMIHCSTK